MAAAPKNLSFSLCEADAGSAVTVTAVDTGERFTRVTEMGMVPGTHLTVRSRSGRQALVVQLRGATIAIDQSLCAGVYVVAEAG